MPMTKTVRARRRCADLVQNSLVATLALAGVAALAAVLVTVAVQGWPIVSEVGLSAFLLSNSWMPVDFGTGASFGIANFIAGSVAVSVLALALALLVAIGCALFLSCAAGPALRAALCSAIDLLAGIPSVVYGFVGLEVVSKAFIEAGHPSGNCVLTAGIVLAVMVLPFMVSSMTESMLAVRQRYLAASLNLGVGKWYGVYAVVLPVSLRLLWPSVMMAFARAMGETMAVMMVVGNANLFPELLGKGETIASLIALEMGTAAAGSTHMHALFAAGFVLLAIVLAVDAVTAWAQHRLARRASRGVRGGRWVLGRAGACLARGWAWAGMAVVAGCIVFLFAYVFSQGAGCISWEFITQSPSGAILGTEGGIFPAIVGSAWFTATALVIAVPLALALAVYRVFLCRKPAVGHAVGRVISVAAGAPSIVMGLFAYAVLVRDAGLGRCVLAGGVTLALMIIPFIEVRVEKALREMPAELVTSAYALGCTRSYVVRTLVLPYCRGEVLGAVVLGALYALGAAAPLIFTGGVAFAPVPTGIDQPAMSLPLHLYLMLAQGTTIPQVYATAFVLMALVLACNLAVSAYAQIRRRRWMKS